MADSAEEPRRGLLQAAASLDVRVLAFYRKKVGRTLEADNESCRLRWIQSRLSAALVPVGSSRRALQRIVKSPIVAALQSPNRRGEIALAEAGADRLAAAHRETHDRAAFAMGEGAECCSCVCQAVFSRWTRLRTL